MKASLTVWIIVLLACQHAPAEDRAPSKSEVQFLRADITRLESRIKELEAILKAKGVLPPPKAQNPEAWTEVEARFDKDGNLQLDGKPATDQELRQRIAAIFQSGKFPEVRIAAPAAVSFPKMQTLLTTLGELGVPNVSFATRG
ncbi:ExbD/TolR family protein [Prosthecobacter sp.]|uniref:ExbD/TolR family protein n=1 Tax=Prosthecobacter sp. TaxID=1965333 RepID=UPI003783F99C